MALRYITAEELVNEIPDSLQGSMTDDTPNSDTIVSSIILQQAESAEETVESYLSMQYVLPLIASDGTVPNNVKKAIYVLTKYFLYMRRDQIDAQIQAQYDSVISWLSDAAQGKVAVNLLTADGTFQSQGALKIETPPYTETKFNDFI